jgi:hypothetical protein
VRRSKSCRLLGHGNMEDMLPACIVIWPFHQWQTGRHGIMNSQNADSAFIAPHLVIMISYANEGALKPALWSILQ